MEKRLLLAFLLSFFVLATWNILFPPPKPTQKIAQTVDIKRDATSSIPAALEAPPAQQTDVVPGAPEEIKILENDKLRVEFSNIGGTIKQVVIKKYNESLPARNILDIPGHEAKAYGLQSVSSDEIVYMLKEGEAVITKRYSVSKNDYLINASIEIYNSKNMSNKEIQAFSLDVSRLDKNIQNSQEQSLYEYSVYTNEKTIRKSGAIKFSQKEKAQQSVVVNWAGFRNRYFCMIVKPEFKTQGYVIEPKGEKQLNIFLVPAESSEKNTVSLGAVMYFGPQQLDALEKYNKGFEEIMKFSNFGVVDVVAKGIYLLLNLIHRVIPSLGICIIILGVLIYGITYPLTLKGMSSMKKMQSLQPKMTKLREQYKNNPQKLNQEMMELYKEHKVNPFGGCFPMILQMPIFIGLYQVLWRTISFKGANFLWIKDLSMPDRAVILPYQLPIIGNEINLLPLAMGVAMALQQKLSIKSMGTGDPQQESQQKMMMIFLPIMMIFFFYKAASGLTLYFTLLYLLTTFTQWKMSKMTQGS
jgi:YidC/Oxa1 family membrane protein insertase